LFENCSSDLELLARLLRLRNRVGIDGELYGVSFDCAHELTIDEVMMVVVTRSAVFLGQLDAATFDAVDRTNMRTVLADDFHVFPDIRHDFLLCGMN
jgi:hypothetical protein